MFSKKEIFALKIQTNAPINFSQFFDINDFRRYEPKNTFY